MFEISGKDITNLSDVDLRSVVARLALAELKAKGYPLSSVTAGGNQDAADGGLDVRIECPLDITDPDFVPRRLTGFQVKKPDMPPSAIRDEMRPKGILREVIRELADASGAYVIVSSQGSVADKPLADRREAMRAALNDVSSAGKLHTDFYDRERIATWANEYPGIGAWVRSRVGRPLSGWGSIFNWEGGSDAASTPYLSDDKTCLIDENSRNLAHLAIAEGITRLRAGLNEPKQCIRLVGLSGLGKTRLVQALFEDGVGENPLDSSLAVYTDYSRETDPTARDMARALIARRQRAILIVDNCNPETHSELARLCKNDGSEVSLITVEYDVRDDEPEHTEVFRLQSASTGLVTEWIKQRFPDISQVDREKIAGFSDGNFRVAGALAETLGKGETLGSLKSHALFERIFYQRNKPDRQLLQVAEDLSLLYSIDGEDVSSEGELARVGAIRGIGAQLFYEGLVEMRQRGVVQARGRFRAILPQALANPLAAHALDRIPPAHFDQFCKALMPRMLKSVSRRIGFLHDSPVAQATVTRWLQPDGSLGDLVTMGENGFQIITNIAPVAPHAVLARLEQELDGPNGQRIFASGASGRYQWIRLIKAIGYDASLFDRAVTLLAKFLPAELEEGGNDPARDAFVESFHIYLSGTQAAPAQRHAVIRRFADSNDESLRRSVPLALRALLKSGHFMSLGSFDFGARSRDWGWHPKTNRDSWDWFSEAISLVVELESEKKARAILAGSVRGLWRYPTCRDALDQVATNFVQRGPWIEGWIACRAALRYDGKEMPEDVRARLEGIIERLKPLDLLNQARAIVLNRTFGGWDFYDGEEDKDSAIPAWEKARRLAHEIGHALARDPTPRERFFPELLAEPQAQRAFECGLGLAEGADDLEVMWLELVGAYRQIEPRIRNPTALCGFLSESYRRNQSFTLRALESGVMDPDLLPKLPRLQASVGMDEDGIARLRRAIARGGLFASDLRNIANGCVSESPPEPLAALLEDISTLPEGNNVALDVLQMHLHGKDENIEHNARLMSVGRELLARIDFSKDDPFRDYGAGQVIRICFNGGDNQESAIKICKTIHSALDSYHASSHDLGYTLKALFDTHPYVALNEFLLPKAARGIERDPDSPSFIEALTPEVLRKWASDDPHTRYPLLGNCLSLFTNVDGHEGNQISPIFLSMLKEAPDKRAFLGDWWNRMHPGSWIGSLTDIFIQRKAQIMKLNEFGDPQVSAWLKEAILALDQAIRDERGRDRAEEESFE